MANPLAEIRYNLEQLKKSLNSNINDGYFDCIDRKLDEISYYFKDEKLTNKIKYCNVLIKQLFLYKTNHENIDTSELEFREELYEDAANEYNFRGEQSLKIDNPDVYKFCEIIINYINVNYEIVKYYNEIDYI